MLIPAGLVIGFALVVIYPRGEGSAVTGLLAPNAAGRSVATSEVVLTPEAEEFQAALARVQAAPIPAPNDPDSLAVEAEAIPAHPLKEGLLGDLFFRPKTLSAETLFCYRETNPASTQIRESVEAGLHLLERDCLRPLQIMQSLMGRLHYQELERMASSGLLRPLTYKDDPEIQQEIQEARAEDARLGLAGEPMFHGADFYKDAEGLELFCRIDGVVYGATKRDLKHATEQYEFYLASTADAYVKVASYAHLVGLISEVQLAQRKLESSAWIDRFTRDQQPR